MSSDLSLDDILNWLADRIAIRMKADRAGGLSQRLLSVDQAAAYLNRTSNSVRHLIATGKLPSVRLDGRVFLDIRDLDGAIDEAKRSG